MRSIARAATLALAFTLAACGGGGGGGSGGGQVDIPAGVRYAYSPGFNNQKVSVYRVDNSAGVSPVEDVTAVTQSLGAAAVSSDSRFLYQATTASVTTYAIEPSTGKLTYRQDTALPGSGGGDQVLVDPAGRYVYVSGAGFIVTYRVSPTTGELSQAATLALNVNRIAIDPTGRFLYALDGLSDVVVYAVGANGALSERARLRVANNPDSLGGLAVDPQGAIVYATVTRSALPSPSVVRVVALEVDSATGALGVVDAVDAGAGMTAGLAAEPGGRFVYVGLIGSSGLSPRIATFSLDRSTGALRLVTTLVARGNPYGIGFDPTGRFALVQGVLTTTTPPVPPATLPGLSTTFPLTAYTLDAATGGLTEVGVTQTASGRAPVFTR